MLPRPEIAAALERFVLVELFTDRTDAISEANEKLEETKFGTVAEPYYAIVRPDGSVVATFEGRTTDAPEFLAFLSQGTAPATQSASPGASAAGFTALDGSAIEGSGKVLVLDFWATWCGPCRVQHPLYEQVRQRFKDNPDVIFLDVDTDEDRSLVKPFLERQKWSQEVVYDDGLGGFFRLSSIPTTVVLNRRGEVQSRMPVFVPERFVDMLTERIGSALTEK